MNEESAQTFVTVVSNTYTAPRTTVQIEKQRSVGT